MTVTERSSSKLFQPLKIGDITLKHRIIMAPLTRVRSFEHIPGDMGVEYYSQRASDGGLLISEGAHTSVMAGNYKDAPGVFTLEQQRAWKRITDAVHAKGGYIFCQLWHVGRTTHPDLLGGRLPLGPSATLLKGGTVYFTNDGTGAPTVVPKEMTKQDIEETIADYVHASKTAIAAGFDGVEIHAANGYLLHQFLSDNINLRTDAYGGSPENRARFVVEVTNAVIDAIGAGRTGIRFSPFSSFQGTEPSDIIGQWSTVLKLLDNKGLAYVHLLEPLSTIGAAEDAQRKRLTEAARQNGVPESEIDEYISLKPLRKVLKNTTLIACGGYNDKNVWGAIDGGAVDGVVYGRPFISNPDLVERLRNGWKLASYDRNTFYTKDTVGYTDYPTYAQEQEAKSKI